MNGCQYCRMDTAGNHEDGCPMKKRKSGLYLGSATTHHNFDGPIIIDDHASQMLEVLNDMKRLLESIDRKVGFIRQKYASNR